MIRRMHHVGVVIDDLAAAVAFFVELGFTLEGEWSAEDEKVDRIMGLEGVRSDVAMLVTPDAKIRLELSAFHAPPAVGDAHTPSNARGLRHLSIEVDDLDDTLARLRPHGAEPIGDVEAYGGSYRLCYLRGPEGILVELAEQLG